MLGAMLRTAAQSAETAASEADPFNKNTGRAVGLRETKMKSAPKTVESMFHTGKAKL